MNICFHVLNAYSLFDKTTHYPYGGAEMRASIFAKELAKDATWNVRFITLDHGQKRMQNFGKLCVMADEFYSADNTVTSRNFMQKIFLKLGWMKNRRLYKNYQDFLRHSSLLESGSEYFILFGVSGLNKRVVDFCRLNNKKLVLSFASDEELNQQAGNFLGLQPGLTKYFVENAALVFCQNNFQLQKLKSDFSLDGTLLLNPITVDVPYKDKSGDANKSIMWIGKSNAVKDPLKLLAIARLNPEKQFIMFCSKSDATLHEQVKRELPANVRFIDNGTSEMVEQSLSAAHILISTSAREGFANVFLQAGKFSVPLISSEVDPNQYITKFNCGFVCSSKTEDINEKLQSLFEDPELYKRSAFNHYNYVKQHHNTPDVIEKFKQLMAAA